MARFEQQLDDRARDPPPLLALAKLAEDYEAQTRVRELVTAA